MGRSRCLFRKRYPRLVPVPAPAPARCQQVAGGTLSSTESDRRTNKANVGFVVASASECRRKGIRSGWRSNGSTVRPCRRIPTRPPSDSFCRTPGREKPSQSPWPGPGRPESAASRCHLRDIEPLDRVAWEQDCRSLLGRGGSALGHGSVLHHGQSMNPSHTDMSCSH